MKSDLPLKPVQPRRKWIPFFVGAIALVLTAEATSYVAITAKAKDKLRFENAVERTQGDIQDRLNTYITLLRGGSGLFAANEQVSNAQFSAFVNRLNLRQRYPGVQGIGFSVRVRVEEKDALVAQMKKQGVENFSIRPNYQRSEYYPIIYLEPQDRRNKVAIGFDMFSESTRKEAMERARDTGAPAASDKVTLIQEIDKQKQTGFLICVPVYGTGGIPNTVASRQATLKGFVYSPFRVKDLMAGIFGNEKYPSVNFQIYSGRNLSAANLLYSSLSANGGSDKPDFTTTKTIDVAGQPWSIAFASQTEFDRTLESSLVPYVALGGCAIAAVLFAITRSLVRARDAAERLAATAHSSSEALRSNEERYRAFIEQSSEGIWRFELEQPLSIERPESEQIQHFYQYGYLAECNHVMAKMYGFSEPKEIVGVRLADLLVQSEPLNIEYLRSFIRSGYKLNAAESFEVDKDGKRKYFLNNLVGIVENNFLVRAWGTQLDITDRKQVQEALRKSEERYRFLVEATTQIIWNTKVEGEFVTEQPSWSAFTGQTYDELKGWGWLNAIHPDDQELTAQAWSTAVANRTLYKIEHRLRRYDGEYRYMSVRAVPMLEADGSIREWVGVHTDITERKQAEEALRESNARLQFTLEAGQLGDWDLDLVTKTARRSLRHDRIFGYDSPLANWSYEIFLNHVHPEDREFVERKFQNTLSTGEDWNFECRIIRLDQSIRWIWARGSIYQPDGIPIRMIGIVTDITERKQTESALRFSEARLRRVVESGMVGIVFWDIDGNITDANDAFLDMVGYTQSDLLAGRIKWREMTPQEYRHLDEQALEEMGKTGVSTVFEKEYFRQDGSRIPILLGAALLEGFEDRGVAFVLDICDRKRIEVERAQLLKREQAARAEAEAANRMKDEFLATLSHELRTPLNAMLGWTTLLRTRKFNEATTARALETIDRNTKSLAQLIEDVLDVSRIITGKFRMNISPVQLAPIIEAAIETVLPTAEAKDIQIETILDSSVDTVLGDATRLQQVVWNLLSNALKFTPQHGCIEVRLELNNSHVQIQVSDSGQGISPEFLPYVFDRFRQADSSTTRVQGGLGLGLAIVRHIVELHGGIVYAESPGEGQGATFTVKLPLLEEDRKTRSKLHSGAGEMSSSKDGEIPQSCELPVTIPSLTGVRVLVVDDEPDAREMIASALDECGAEVKVVASAPEAIEAIAQWQPDILVSDIGMPGEDGYTLIRKIRAIDPKGEKIPAIALTAYAGDEDRRQALSAGFQLHLPKPVNPSELATVVNNLTKRNNNS